MSIGKEYVVVVDEYGEKVEKFEKFEYGLKEGKFEGYGEEVEGEGLGVIFKFEFFIV